MEKIFELKKDNLKLKIEIKKHIIITSWLHKYKNEYSNHRKFDITKIEFVFDTVKPICSISEINSIENFMFSKEEGEQLSLF